jgi:hypothetical protein
MGQANFNLFLGYFDCIMAFSLLLLMRPITEDAAFTNHKTRWSFFRRAVYSLVSIALAARGFAHFKFPDAWIGWDEALSQVVIIGGLLVFPLLAAIKVWSHDKFLAHFHPMLDPRD